MPTVDHLALVERVRQITSDEPLVLAAWIAGSLANGIDDDYSDVDLHLLVSDADLDEFHHLWMDLIQRIGPMVMVRPIAGAVGGYAITPSWMHIDVVCHAAGTFTPTALRGCWSLFDRVGVLPAGISPGPTASREPYFPADTIDFYYYLLGNLAVVLGRGELTLGQQRSDRASRLRARAADARGERGIQVGRQQATQSVPDVRAAPVSRVAAAGRRNPQLDH
ncbi:MAG TPA: hypothetical protein VH442_01885 [Micromonosporaceae bacterium]|jgi:hypothetical protein